MESTSTIPLNMLQSWMERIEQKLNSIEQKVTPKTEEEILMRRMDNNKEELYDNGDLCEMLHISKRTLRRYRASGKIQYKLKDTKIYYTKAAVREFIRNYG